MAFPVRTSATPDSEPASTARDPDSGANTFASFAYFCPSDCGRWQLKTSQGCLLEDWIASSVIWPSSGVMRNGKLYERPTSARLTDERESSSWPTPQTQYDGRTEEQWEIARARADEKRRTGQYAIREWPTPTSSDGGSNSQSPAVMERGHGTNLLGAMDWSTPTARDKETLAKVTRGANASAGGTPLLVQVQNWPTPQASDGLKTEIPASALLKNFERQKKRPKGAPLNLTVEMARASHSGPPDLANHNTTGSRPVVLNPRWVAALMGFPVDWLDGVAPVSKRSGTPSSRKSQKSSRAGSDLL